MVKRISVSDKAKKEANHWGQWVVIAAILGFVSLAFLDHGDDYEYEATPMAAMYAAPAYDPSVDELWAEICKLQEEVGAEKSARCE